MIGRVGFDVALSLQGLAVKRIVGKSWIQLGLRLLFTVRERTWLWGNGIQIEGPRMMVLWFIEIGSFEMTKWRHEMV